MWNYKIAMATFRTSQCQDGDEVLKCHEWRCQGIKRRFRKPKHTKEHIKKDSNRYIVELDCESDSSPMILIGNQMVYSWNKGITSLVTMNWLYMLLLRRGGTKREHLIPCVASSLFRHFQNMKGTRAELTFAKTSGTVTRDRKKISQ